MLIWFLPLFLIFLLIGIPVFFSLLAAPGILLWLNDQGVMLQCFIEIFIMELIAFL